MVFLVSIEISKVGSRGQITIPKEIREKEGIESEDYVVIMDLDGKIIIEKLNTKNWLKRVREIEERGEEYPGLDEIVEEVHEAREEI